jgi:hypothetical protein
MAYPSILLLQSDEKKMDKRNQKGTNPDYGMPPHAILRHNFAPPSLEREDA